MTNRHLLCPCPKTASREVQTLFKDVVERTPAGSFNKADQAALLSYCQLTAQLSKLTRQQLAGGVGGSNNLTRRANQMSHAIRSLSVRLGLKQLQSKALRSDEQKVEIEIADIVAKVENDPDHPRYGLMGTRVVSLT